MRRKDVKTYFTKEKVDKIGEVFFFSCFIAGEEWRYALITTEQMLILTDNDLGIQGLCDSETNSIYISKGAVVHPVIIHELCHAHMAQSHSYSADLSSDQVEEVMCDVFAFNWAKILLLSRVIAHNLKTFESYLEGKKNLEWFECAPEIITDKFPKELLNLISNYSTTKGNPFTRTSRKRTKK